MGRRSIALDQLSRSDLTILTGTIRGHTQLEITRHLDLTHEQVRRALLRVDRQLGCTANRRIWTAFDQGYFNKLVREPLRRNTLTDEDLQHLQLMVRGLSAQQVGHIYGMSRSWVSRKWVALYERMGAENHAHAIALAIQNWLVDRPPGYFPER
jgi:DNA-binding CsgD family transcriptional regulator